MARGVRIIKAKWNDVRVLDTIEREMRRRLDACGVMVVDHCHRRMGISTQASGPSAPGDYPHADSGRLRASVEHSTEDLGNGSVATFVGTNLDYAPHVHKTRPFLLMAIDDKRPDIISKLSREMR